MIRLDAIGWGHAVAACFALAAFVVVVAFNAIGFAFRHAIRRDHARLGRGDTFVEAPARRGDPR